MDYKVLIMVVLCSIFSSTQCLLQEKLENKKQEISQFRQNIKQRKLNCRRLISKYCEAACNAKCCYRRCRCVDKPSK
jgi:hypothetical protein